MRVGIYTYGNLGRGVEYAALKSSDTELAAIFTRRCPEAVVSPYGTEVYSTDSVLDFKDKIDVMIVCGGSSEDLPKMSPQLLNDFNIVDSFDTHIKAEAHFNDCDRVARESGHVAVLSAGWDPGIFSLARLYSNSFFEKGRVYTLWGPGISQGHSDAVRRIKGVKDARQYTIPRKDARALIKDDKFKRLAACDLHKRVCYVSAESASDKKKIEKEIRSMPGYFKNYETEVSFTEHEELLKYHTKISHAGSVISKFQSGKDDENMNCAELTLKLDSNPEFTGAVLLAYARAAFKISKRGHSGAKTVFDIAPNDLSPLCDSEIRRRFL